QRADHIARRKCIYEQLYPQTRHGGDRRSEAAGSNPQLEDLKKNSFAEETAEKTGRSRQSVERDARRGNAVEPDIMAELVNTPFDTGVYLDKLAKLPPEQQREKFDRDMAAGHEVDKSTTPNKTATPNKMPEPSDDA